MRKNSIRTISLLVALVMALSMIAASAFATEQTPQTQAEHHEKLDVNTITNFGQEPAEMVVKTGTEYFEKQWYEYITYSDLAISSYRLDSNSRIIFYDPFDYLSSMIMDVQYDPNVGWSTANSITFTHEFSKSFSTDSSSSTSTDSSLEHAEGPDMEYSKTDSASLSTSKSVHETFSISAEASATVGTEASSQTTAGITMEEAIEEFGVKIGSTQSVSETIGISATASATVSESVYDETGWEESINSDISASETSGWSTVADRITMSTGSSTTTSTGWSSTESTSISRTFEAAYFNADGAPLTWTVASYTVKMPMKAVMQQKIGGKWVTIDTDYVLLTTISGTCRAWIENGTIMYEHWGTGEPVADADFWSGYFTGDNLAAAYKTKLYPNT